MTSALPAGTVTFLFTDIEGSTPLWEAEPAPMRLALAQHDAILRQAVAARQGVLYKTIGDAIQAAFALPADALAAALAAQLALAAAVWPTSAPLRVRMGLHTGPAEPAGADYATTHTLNRVARIMSAAHGGQIVLSVETAELLRGYLPPDSRLRDLGQHRMKGLTQREHLFQPLAPGLPSEFPPLATLDAAPNNLPVALTSFIGRETEMAEARRLLAAARLLTLTGPGGTGKTRLSLQIAAEVLPEYADGAWLVELAPLASPALVAQAVAAALGVREQPGRPLVESLLDYLRARTVLLLLDNCEHLIDACAQLATALLSACPRLKLLASSREALGIAGETAYRVPSLDLPQAGQTTVDTLGQCAAARLFVERAQAAQPRFVLNAHNLEAVVQITNRLDGIPLAIELAAARVKVLSAEQIVDRLDDRFRLLTGGSRTALPRQQTLRALIDWSYDLLPEPERAAWQQLSVFAGGWTLEAAEAVIGPEALDLLARLADKSLVSVEAQDGAARYRLLESMRQYGRDKLLDAARGEAAAARDRHLAFFLQSSQAAGDRLRGAEMIAALDELEVEQDNLRAALEWALDHNPLAALELAAALWMFFGRRTSASEGRQWLAAALAAAGQAPGAAERDFMTAKARVLTAEASLAFQVGDSPAALAAAKAGMALARAVDDPRTLVQALGMGGTVSGMMGDVATPRAWLQECLALCRQHGYGFELGMFSGGVMFLEMVANVAPVTDLRAEMIGAARASGSPWAIALAVQNAARVSGMMGDYAAAYAGFQETAALYRQIGDRHFENASRSELAHVLRKQARYAEAAAIYAGTLPVWQELGQRAAVAHELECLAFIAAAMEQLARAALLLGAAEALREHIGATMPMIERREYEPIVAQVRAQAEPAKLAAAWARGRGMTVDEAVAEAIKG